MMKMMKHLLEPDAERIFALCDHCGGEIYEGEDYYEIDGDSIHADCLYDYIRDLYADCRREADCRERYDFCRS